MCSITVPSWMSSQYQQQDCHQLLGDDFSSSPSSTKICLQYMMIWVYWKISTISPNAELQEREGERERQREKTTPRDSGAPVSREKRNLEEKTLDGADMAKLRLLGQPIRFIHLVSVGSKLEDLCPYQKLLMKGDFLVDEKLLGLFSKFFNRLVKLRSLNKINGSSIEQT